MTDYKIGVIGIGKLGLALSLNFEKAGFKVYGCDIRDDYVEKLNKKNFTSIEPHINGLLDQSKNFIATTSLENTILNSNIIFITVRTETNQDGSYDVSQCDKAVDSLIKIGYQNEQKSIVINCNVNPGYTESVRKRLKPLNYKTSFNPEWVAQGTIVDDQIKPDVIVIGEEDNDEGIKIENLYKKMCHNSPPVFKMNSLSAELTKISLNCFLTTKITFANMIGDIANSVGADHKKILSAIGSDSRIGKKYFSYGFGYGGPCFPRDNRALIKYMKSNNIEPVLPNATQDFNQLHLKYQIKSFIENNQDMSKPIKIKGVTYKPGVDILEESQQLQYALELANHGYKVVIEDLTSVCLQIKKLYGDKFAYIEI